MMQTAWNNKILYTVLVLYMIVSAYSMAHHEVWGDEVHSWNIAKGSNSYSDLIANRRYEGHPPGWYSILWVLSKFTHQVAYMQVVQWTIACLVVFFLLFFSPLTLTTKILLPFGYYFLFEYAVFSRNYAVGVFLVFVICFIMKKKFRYKLPLYYGLLFCLSNIHMLALLLAGSLHLYFFLSLREEKGEKKTLLLHIFLGILVLLPACYFIIPPPDGQLNLHFWMNLWNIHQLSDVVNAPLRCLLPIPAWWEYNFWNTQFLLEAKNAHPFLKIVNPLIALAFLAGAFFVLRKNKKSLALFGANLLMSFVIGAGFFSLSTARYAGFIYIGFIAAWWLYCSEMQVTKTEQRPVTLLLSIHLAAGIFAVSKDIRYPFANLFRINELIKEVPVDKRLVTDYWTMNAFVAFTDRPAYCVDTRKNMSFVLWGPDVTSIHNVPDRYTSGLKDLFQKQGIHEVYMISMASAQMLMQADSFLSKSFRLVLVDKREGALLKGGNLYLYQISDLTGNP